MGVMRGLRNLDETVHQPQITRLGQESGKAIQQRTIFSRCSITWRVALRVSITSRAWRTMKG